LPHKLPLAELIPLAQTAGVISEAEATALREAERLRYAALQVDSFAPGELEQMGCDRTMA